ncbi:protein ELC [Panicum miliaceum]|uniref:Protein ELC n=1 Tax=Panicum miliaceum TaxID=4540 RepID=A0A3L6STW3_PANMI|nr:protein ELC [Panicum miliaceum]
MATAAAAGTVVLVDAALDPYEHPDLRWLVRKHVLAVLQEFPTLSPSVDTYTSDDGASTVLLNARGLLAVSPALPPVLLTVWLPREYPYRPPLVYALPAAPTASLVPDHPFVDHRTGRVHRTLPYLEEWSVPRSSLAGLVRSLVTALRMCHPLTASFGLADATTRARATPVEEERRRMHAVLVDELASRLGRDAAAFRGGVDRDIHALSSLQSGLRARGDAMGRAVRDLEEERMRLERAVTASLVHRGELLSWLCTARRAPDPGAALAPRAAAGDAPRWLESKASELAADDAIDALGHALESGELNFQEYIKRVKVLAREQFFHCYAASTSMNT